MFRVYVGNLPFPARQAEVKQFFVDGGIPEDKIEDVVVPLTEDDRSKGFGFVQVADEETYQKVLAMNGKEMDGRALRINEARPRENRGGDQPAAAPTTAPAEEPATEEATAE
jgi:cold-inducible RNA-binding protein